MAIMNAILRRFLTATLLSGVVAGPALASGRLEIPFRINHRDHMVVDLQINDAAEVTGVVDTAATFAMVDSTAALRSGIAPPSGDARMVNILGVNGDRNFPVVQLGTVAAGNVRLNAVDAAYNEDIAVPGSPLNVLPASAIPGDVLEFDFEEGIIAVYDGKPRNAPSRYVDTLDYTVEGGLVFVSIRMNGKRGRALIDTGSSITYINSVFADIADVERDDQLTRYLLGATGETEDLWVGTPRKVRLGDFMVERPSLMVSDPVLLDRLGLADQPVMVIGLDFLSKFRVQFDRPRSHLLLSVPGHKVGGVRLDLSAPASRLDD